MANLAENVVSVQGIDPTEKKDFLNDLENAVEEVTNDPENNWDDDDNWMEISFLSRWKEPSEDLELLAIKYDCTIIGVVWEFANGYVNHFEC